MGEWRLGHWVVKKLLFEEGLIVINEVFTKYAKKFRGGDERNNRFILLSNITDGINNGKVRSCSVELTEQKTEIAALMKKLLL